jgi:hypothetical protein
MKACKKFQIMLSAYVDGELSPDQRKLVQEELESCEGCRAEYQSLLRMKALIWEVSQEEQRSSEERSVWAGVEAAISAEAPSRERAGWSIRGWLERYRMGLSNPMAPVGLATALTTLIIAAFLMVLSDFSDVKDSPQPLRHLAMEESAQTPAGELAEAADTVGSSHAAMTHPRRAPEKEKSFRRNECFVDSTNIEEGIVIVDIDPEEDIPVIVWHFQEDPEVDLDEDGAI